MYILLPSLPSKNKTTQNLTRYLPGAGTGDTAVAKADLFLPSWGLKSPKFCSSYLLNPSSPPFPWPPAPIQEPSSFLTSSWVSGLLLPPHTHPNPLLRASLKHRPAPFFLLTLHGSPVPWGQNSIAFTCQLCFSLQAPLRVAFVDPSTGKPVPLLHSCFRTQSQIPLLPEALPDAQAGSSCPPQNFPHPNPAHSDLSLSGDESVPSHWTVKP